MLHLVPKVPDSSNGFSKYTHRESTYKRALTLSNAFTTTSKPPQNSSSKTSSVSGLTRFCNAVTFNFELIFFAAFVAHVDFGCLMSQSRNKNCLDKLDFSMMSSSVMVSLPSPEAPQETPINARFLMNSHPNAPAPTKKTFCFSMIACVACPKHCI